MKKIVPFEKEIFFKTNIAEIISIALDHELDIKNCNIDGKFIVSGEYKILSESINNEKFNYELPFNVNIDEKYKIDKANIEIDDFYYEIINDNVLKINIDILIDNLEEKDIYEKKLITDEEEIEAAKERCIEEEVKEKCIEEEVKHNIFNIDQEETYKSYTIYIVRENDTLEEILKKYNVSKELLEQYNDLTEIKIGQKLIIP